MGIPIVTSIWRGLAYNADILKTIWGLTKPIYLTGEPEFIFNKTLFTSFQDMHMLRRI